MKKLTGFLALIACLSLVVNAQTNTGEKRRHLAGAVQSMRVETADIVVLAVAGAGSSGPRESRRNRIADYAFDNKAQLVQSTRYEDSKVVQRETFKYDDKARLTEELYYDAKNALMGRIAHAYTAEGRSESLQYDEKGKTTSKVVYKYDLAPGTVEESFFSEKKPTGKAVLVYDKAGRLSGVIGYNGSGDVVRQIAITYDEKANAIQRATYGPSGKLEGKTVTISDAKQNVTMIAHYRADGSPAWKWEFEYDDRGNVAEEQFSNSSNLSVWVYKYQYDSKGNWTKKTSSQLFNVRGKVTSSLSSVAYRTLEYYPEATTAASVVDPVESASIDDAAIAMPQIRMGSARKPARGGSISAGPLVNFRKSGTVEVEMVVDTEGNVESARVVNGGELISENPSDVEQNARIWKWRPALFYGVPVRFVSTVKQQRQMPVRGRGSW
jgi:hypothetical protein